MTIVVINCNVIISWEESSLWLFDELLPQQLWVHNAMLIQSQLNPRSGDIN